jgi:4-hydroxy-tetrahydrodipicolinate synthase
MPAFTVPDGAYPILLTAFTKDNELDLSAIGALLDFYQELGIPGVLALGQASEVLLLNDDERFQVAEYVANHRTGDLMIATVGNFGTTLQDQANSLQKIYDMGTDVVVIGVSLLPSPDHLGDQLVELTKLVGDNVRLGIYELPEPEHRLLSPEEVAQVAQTGRYFFMKDTCRQIDPFTAKVNAANGSNLKLFQANLKVLPPSMDAGSHGFCGWMPVVSPELCAQVVDMTNPSDVRQSAHDKLMAFNDVMVAHGFPSSAKHILAKRGVNIQPYSRATAGQKFFEMGSAKLDSYIKQQNPFEIVAVIE